MNMTPSDSSMFSEHGHDADTDTLGVRYRNGGKLYYYDDIPLSDYRMLCAAESFGKAFHAWKGKRVGREVKEPPADMPVAPVGEEP